MAQDFTPDLVDDHHAVAEEIELIQVIARADSINLRGVDDRARFHSGVAETSEEGLTCCVKSASPGSDAQVRSTYLPAPKTSAASSPSLSAGATGLEPRDVRLTGRRSARLPRPHEGRGAHGPVPAPVELM